MYWTLGLTGLSLTCATKVAQLFATEQKSLFLSDTGKIG
jgi:hypothetical protein